MSYSTIHSLLDAQLETVVGLPTLYKENTRAEAKTGVAYSRSTLLPAESNALSTDTDELQGLYQIDLFYPMDKGVDTSNEIGDLVKAAFPRGLVLETGSTRVHIRMSWREVGQTFQQFYQLPIVVRWTCLLPKS